MPTAQRGLRPLASIRAGSTLRGPTTAGVQQDFHQACLMLKIQVKRFAMALASVSSTMVAKREVRMS